jgi:hypothetical protein
LGGFCSDRKAKVATTFERLRAKLLETAWPASAGLAKSVLAQLVLVDVLPTTAPVLVIGRPRAGKRKLSAVQTNQALAGGLGDQRLNELVKLNVFIF